MGRGRLILAVGAAAFAACGSSTSASSSATMLPAQSAGGGIVGNRVTADPIRTPGVPSPAVTQATIHATICVSGWTKTVRPPTSYTDRLKVQQLAADPRYTDHNPAHFEEDHLIPLEIGGDPRDPGNLWPEPHDRSGKADIDENRLHSAVCDGTMTLADAQAQIGAEKHTLG